MTRQFAAAIAVIAFGAGAALAEDAKGIWLTQADKKGQVAHVEAASCGGGALCGTIVRAFDSGGAEIVTPNVGKKIFWDMRAQGDGSYEGVAFVPAHNREYRATMTVSGNEMLVKGCLGPVCQSQLWTRVR